MSTETQVAETILYTLLSTDEDLIALVADRIYPYIAPTNAVFPYVIYNLQGAAKDVKVVGSIRIMSNLLYQVKAVGCDTIFEEVDPVAVRVDKVLDRAEGICDAGAVFSISREAPLSYPEVANKKIYLHRGGLYRVFAQSAN